MVKIVVILLLGIIQVFAGHANSAPTKLGSPIQESTSSDSPCNTGGILDFGAPQLNQLNSEEEVIFQQLLLNGFREYVETNTYRLRQGGFTSDINYSPPCIYSGTV